MKGGVLIFHGERNQFQKGEKMNRKYILALLAITIFHCATAAEIKSREDNQAFIEAIEENQISTVKRLIDEKRDINSKAKNGQSVLAYAVSKSRIEIVKMLIAKGANVNDRDNDGASPLFVASEKEIVRILTTAGADVNIKNDKGQTALYIYAKNCDPFLVREIIKAKADANIATDTENTPLIAAAGSSRFNCGTTVEALIAAKAKIEARDKYGQTALMLAAATKYSDTTEVLIAAGADLNAKSSDGLTPLAIAVDEGNQNDAVRLVKAGADVSLLNDSQKRILGQYMADHEAYMRKDDRKVTVNSKFCSDWASAMPSAATPRHSGDIERACSNAWARGSNDFAKCVQTWKDCAKFY